MTATSSGKLSVSFAFLWFGYIVARCIALVVTFLSAAFRISFAVPEFTLTLAFGFLLFLAPRAAIGSHGVPWRTCSLRSACRMCMGAAFCWVCESRFRG